MLGREPRSTDELLMVYAGIMAHGTNLTAAECSRMIPQLSATGIRQAMRWATDERRLAQASYAVLEFMHRHPIAESWGRADLASSDHDEHGDDETSLAGAHGSAPKHAIDGIY